MQVIIMKSKEELREYINKVSKLKVTIDESRIKKNEFEKELDKIIEDVENKKAKSQKNTR